jgi:hypothetical protein
MPLRALSISSAHAMCIVGHLPLNQCSPANRRLYGHFRAQRMITPLNKNKQSPVDNFTHMVSETPRPILMNSGTLGGLNGVINLPVLASIGSWDFVQREVENGLFPIINT